MGYHFHWVKQGDTNRPIVLFLHGFMGSSTDFDGAIVRLTSQFCCLSVDLPGHGTTRVTGDATLFSMARTAEGLVEWLDTQAIDRCGLVGYSMGGRVALYLALRWPQRFPKVVLESASPGLQTELERRDRLRHDYALAEQIEANFPAFLEHWYAQPLFEPLRQHPAFAAILQQRSRQSPQGLAQSLRHLSTGAQPSLWDALPHHTQPLLLLVGERDRKFVALNQAMVTRCPTAQLQIIPNCGHTIHLESPDAFSAAVRMFLA